MLCTSPPPRIWQLLALVFISFFFTTCKRLPVEYRSDAADKFSLNDAKEWYYGVFKKSAEWKQSAQKGKKLPDWNYGRYRKSGNLEIIEFPLIKNSKTFAVPSGRVTSNERTEIANSSLSRIAFIKIRGQGIVVREVDYIPDLAFLRSRGYDISNVSLGNNINGFSGQIRIKNWKGTFVSSFGLDSGRFTKRLTRIPEKDLLSLVQGRGGGEDCEITEYCDEEMYCTGWFVGDTFIPTGECTPWLPTDDCYYDMECDFGSGNDGIPPDDCELYGVDCDGGGGGGYDDTPPAQPDPCSTEQAQAVTTFSTNSIYTSSKSQIESAFSSDGAEHDIAFGKDANGNIIRSVMTTGNDHTATVGVVENRFTDLHNHKDNKPPSSGDIYGFIDISIQDPAFDKRYIVTANGTVYTLSITNRQAAIDFNNNHQRQAPIGDNEPSFPENIVNEIDKMQGWGNANEEMAIAFILSKYNTGISILKENNNGDFKRLKTKEITDNNGNKTYQSNNCQ